MAYTTIHNKSQHWRKEEAVAAAAVSPGMLGEIASTGKVQAHSTEGGRAEKIIVLEDALQGRSIETAYSKDERVSLAFGLPGDVWNILLAAGENVSKSDELISGGDGTLKARSNASSPSKIEQTVARADEAKDNSGGSAAVLIAVRLA